MKKRGIGVFLILLFASFSVAVFPVYADEYSGWEEIRPCLQDGDGAEFIVPIPGLGSWAFGGVQEVAGWVAYYMDYEADPANPGDVWTTSDQQYAEIDPDHDLIPNFQGTGDCEDYAILLCALLRFHTMGGIPASRVWVVVGFITVPGVGRVMGHAWVCVKMGRMGIIYIEPQQGWIFRGNLPGYGGQMMKFNDMWLKGGGQFLAGPPEE